MAFSWHNGFGDRLTGHYCGVYLPRWQYNYRGGARSQEPRFRNCDTVADFWRDISNQLAMGRNTQDPGD